MGWFGKSKKSMSVQELQVRMASGGAAIKTVGDGEALAFYKGVAALYNAVDIISSEVASLDLFIYDRQEDIYLTRSDKINGIKPGSTNPLALLASPNPTDRQRDFIKTLTSYFLLAGDCYLIENGEIDKAPLELYAPNPADVELNGLISGTTSPDTYQVRFGGSQQNYRYSEQQGRARYLAKIGQLEYELAPCHNFTPSSKANNPQKGLAATSSLYYEIQQFVQGNVFNETILKQGFSGSALMILDPEYNLENAEALGKLQRQVEGWLSGSKNAGRAFLNAAIKDVKALDGLKNRDMQYKELRDSIETTIYNAYRVPLALVRKESMTMANLENSKLALYDNAALPIAKIILEFLTHAILPRYGLDTNRYEYAYDESTIPALAIRRYEQVKRMKDLQCFTDNELRAAVGYEPHANGDSLPNDRQLGLNYLEVDEKGDPYQKFLNLMRMQKKRDGSRKFSDTKIIELAAHRGISRK